MSAHPFSPPQTASYGPSVRIPRCTECGKPRNNKAHAAPQTSEPHACHANRIRKGDRLVFSEGSRTVVDVEHTMTPFVGRTVDVYLTSGRRIVGAMATSECTVIPGPDHPAH